jgi:HTH-type transcriptional regulator / antitoxin HigA
MKITKAEYVEAEIKMEKILAIATQKGGFALLNETEANDLDQSTQIVKKFEEENFSMPMPETFEGLLELKMFEKKLKQKDLAKILQTTDTQLSEIIHKKRKPSVAFLKSMNQVLGIDGNLLLRIV